MKMRILAIEDETQICELLQESLKEFTSEFVSTSELKTALEWCAIPNRWDLIIVDLRLTDADVDETIAQLRPIKKLQPNCGLIVCSGMPIPFLKERCIEAGADAFVAKGRAFVAGMHDLIITVHAAMLHVSPREKPETFMQSVRTLASMAERISS